MFNKRLVALFSVVMLMLSMCLSMTAFAADVEIGKCDTSDALCVALQNQYGADSTVMYSQTATSVCGNKIEVEVNGTTQIVYISNVEEVAPPPPSTDTNNGQIEDSGLIIKPGSTGINEIELPQTSMDEILNWATTKGNEIIYVLQIFCQPFAIIIFIIAAFMTLIGCIGKSDMVGKGVWGMVLSVVVYAAVLYAPVILQSFVGWVAS